MLAFLPSSFPTTLPVFPELATQCSHLSLKAGCREAYLNTEATAVATQLHPYSHAAGLWEPFSLSLGLPDNGVLQVLHGHAVLSREQFTALVNTALGQRAVESFCTITVQPFQSGR